MRKLLAALALSGLLLGSSFAPATAGPLPAECTKEKGTVPLSIVMPALLPLKVAGHSSAGRLGRER